MDLSTGATQRRKATMAACAVLALVYAWFWAMCWHRVHGTPWVGFSSVFVTGCGDFEHFYHAALAMRHGDNIYSSGVQGYIYPPLLAFVMMPLSLLSVQHAAQVMLSINLLLALGCTWMATREAMQRLDIEPSVDKTALIAALTTVLIATKLRSELQMWQTNVAMMFFILLAMRLLETRPRLAGLCLGFAVNIKYLPIVLIGWLLARRRWQAAGWSLLGIAAFALLPALATGWQTNLHNLAVAFSGILKLMGLHPLVAQVAHVDPITAGHSVSIPSGIARTLAIDADPRIAMALSGVAALAAAMMVVGIYRAHGVPLLRWPAAAQQQETALRGIMLFEWTALMALVLAFSPQTNPRHTCLLLMVFAPMAAMLCAPKAGVSRRLALIATAILFAGLDLPPNTALFATPHAWFHNIGGTGWSIVAMLPFFLAAGLRYVLGMRDSDAPDAPAFTAVPAAP